LARARLRSSAQAAVNAIPADTSTLAEVDTGQVAVPRAQQIKDIEAAMTAWGTEHRRGMIAVIGDRGTGKSKMLDLAAQRGQALLPDLPVKRLALPRRLSEPGPALQWLTDATGTCCSEIMDCESDVEALADSLRTLPSTIYLVDDLHRLVLRKVGGVGAARAVLRVMLATSQKHLWVCAIHKPTWNYLSGLRNSINLEALRSRIDLGPLPAAELGDWIKARVRSAGYSVAFDRLVGGNPVGMDARRARARAEQAYWRILADTSMGIPAVAWGYFRGGLCVGKGVRALDAHIFSAPSTADLEHLPDLDLFVLTAVVIHDELSSSAISDVLNAPLAQVQEACRHLDGLGVLCSKKADRSWLITPAWYPAVQRILRQRHFLYLR
ncbi:MAG: hypothetical protein GXP62_10835, partial [Oligoflexia bacterium]|nr:hypothetical protein [Oligoflexia bacterium]